MPYALVILPIMLHNDDVAVASTTSITATDDLTLFQTMLEARDETNEELLLLEHSDDSILTLCSYDNNEQISTGAAAADCKNIPNELEPFADFSSQGSLPDHTGLPTALKEWTKNNQQHQTQDLDTEREGDDSSSTNDGGGNSETVSPTTVVDDNPIINTLPSTMSNTNSNGQGNSQNSQTDQTQNLKEPITCPDNSLVAEMNNCPLTPNNYEPPQAAAVTGNEKTAKAIAATLTPFPGITAGIPLEGLDNVPEQEETQIAEDIEGIPQEDVAEEGREEENNHN